MKVLENLEPYSVFAFFEELCAIPHGSGNTKPVSDWCVAFAKARGLAYVQDETNNVIIMKEATPGYERAEPVILQGHLDMVCEKEPGNLKDMETEGLDLAVDGDVISAKGTTLGGDDGIAVAMALAVLDSKDLPHPRIEAVFTVDEEIGMLGAAVLDLSPLKGRRLLNLDSEEEGIFTVSCAGGNRTECILPLVRTSFAGTILRVTVGGLLGGHSGAEIHKNRGNSSMLMGRVLCALSGQTDLRLVSVDGGAKDNAIPRETIALLVAADADAAKKAIAEMDTALKHEYRVSDPDVFVRCAEAALSGTPMDADTTQKAVCLLTCLPNGVQFMSNDIPGLVQTSLNLGILTTGQDELIASFCVRSSAASQKAMLVDRLDCLSKQLGGSIRIHGDYPAWEYRENSTLRDLCVDVFREQYGHDPKVEAIHAGVECGLFSGKLPDLDCLSLGPNLTEIHTYREKMSISSVQRVWNFITEVLRRSK